MKKIKFIYATMLLVLALAMNACDDYYSVTVNGDPGITPTVLITPEESITLPAKEAAGEIEIISNMDNSTISFHVPSDAERWCSVTLEGNRISLALEDNPRMIARSTILTIKVFSVTRKTVSCSMRSWRRQRFRELQAILYTLHRKQKQQNLFIR